MRWDAVLHVHLSFFFRFLSLFPDIPSDSSLRRLFRSFELTFWHAAFEVFLYQITYALAFDFLAPYVHEQAVSEGGRNIGLLRIGGDLRSTSWRCARATAAGKFAFLL